MKKYFYLKLFAAAVFVTGFAAVAFADGYDLATKNTKLFNTFSGSAATGDKALIFDASDNKWETIELSDFPLPAGTFTGTLTLDDGTGASPSLVLTDETNESATFSKVDAGFLTVTTVAGDGVQVTTGNLKVGNGTPGVTQDGEDAYIEGTLEVDGATRFDGSVDIGSTFTLATVAVSSSAAELNYNDVATLGTLAASKAWTSDASLDTIMPTGGKLTVQSGGEIVIPTGAVLTVDTVAVNHAPLAFQGRGTFSICGDATTVNNNTVYYGPSQVLTSSATAASVVCDSTAVGNVTEATADAPVLPATAIYPLGMTCWQPDSGNTITYTLRSAEAAITPAISVSIADNILAGSASATATTAVASGATVAIAVASSGDIVTVPFRCDVTYAF